MDCFNKKEQQRYIFVAYSEYVDTDHLKRQFHYVVFVRLVFEPVLDFSCLNKW